MSDADLEADVRRIADRIRRWRDEAGLTLQELAHKSSVATSTIQKIETGQMIPSVAVMLKVARGLDRRPADLIREGSDDVEAVLLRARERHPVGVEGKLLVERLCGDLPDPALETWRVTLHPGHSSGPEMHYGGESIVICEAGELSVRLGEAEHVLRPGDTLHFKAHLPHGWRNDGRKPARFVITGTLPAAFRAAMRDRLAAPARRDRARA